MKQPHRVNGKHKGSNSNFQKLMQQNKPPNTGKTIKNEKNRVSKNPAELNSVNSSS